MNLGYMEDEQFLTERCKKGESSAFKQVYERYAPVLLAVCLRYVGNRMDAEDILHDAFLKIFRSFDKFSYTGKDSLKAWMVRVVINASIEFLRGRQTATASTVDIDDGGIDVADEDYEPPENDALYSIPKEKLMGFIAELPDGYRSVFNLYVFEGKSHKEIGELLGITERTSSSQFSRARRLLRQKITAYLKQLKI